MFAIYSNRRQLYIFYFSSAGLAHRFAWRPFRFLFRRQTQVCGPILFLAYINDVPEEICSQVRLFADGTALYLTIKGEEDSSPLQKDLGTLSVWESKWDMQFSPSKCQVIQVTYKSEYILHGQVLETVTCARYLGVDISSNISWNSHIGRVVGNANRSLGYIRRNIKSKSKDVRESAYNTIVMPQLEYASAVWDPHTKEHISKIEMVQRMAARWTFGNFDNRASVTEMLNKLEWRTLEQRRADACLCLFYKIDYGLVAVPLPNYVQYNYIISRYCQSMTFRQVSTSTDYYRHSFFPSLLSSGMPSLSLLYAYRVWMPSRLASVSCNTLDHNPNRAKPCFNTDFSYSYLV